ncbi:MAG: hypothetical protein ACYDB8_00525 [Acidiferrobacterales bacterium]
MLARIERIAAQGGVDTTLTLSNTARAVIPALARAVRAGAERGTLAALLMASGFSRATAYRTVQRARARVQSDPAGAPGVGAMQPTTAPTAGPVMPTVRPLDARVSAHSPVSAPSAIASKPQPKAPLEHYPADALPPHIAPGVSLGTAAEGGRVWIETLPSAHHAEAPFGVDRIGTPWAPYGRDNQGRFRNYFGAALGVPGRTGSGHFVGEPDEP